jgi:hypothetical protein
LVQHALLLKSNLWGGAIRRTVRGVVQSSKPGQALNTTVVCFVLWGGDHQLIAAIFISPNFPLFSMCYNWWVEILI